MLGMARRGNAITTLDDFTELILHQRLQDLAGVFLTSDQRFAKFNGLLGSYMAREWRFVCVHQRLNHSRTGMFERFAQHGRRIFGTLDREARRSAIAVSYTH